MKGYRCDTCGKFIGESHPGAWQVSLPEGVVDLTDPYGPSLFHFCSKVCVSVWAAS